MLRWVVIALLLANGVYFAGTQGHLAALGWPATADVGEPQRLERQVDPQRLRLLNGPRGAEPPPASGQGSATTASALPAAPAAQQPAELPLPTPIEPAPAVVTASAEAPASTPASPPPVSAVTESTACWQAGGFTDEQAELLRAELRLLGLSGGAWQLNEVRSPGRWIVYMGRYDNAAQANRKKAELRELGVTFRDVGTPGLAPGLALGTFSSEEAAREGLQQTERRGVKTARVAQERAESLTFTLRLPAITDAQRQRIDGLGPAMAGRSLQRCS